MSLITWRYYRRVPEITLAVSGLVLLDRNAEPLEQVAQSLPLQGDAVLTIAQDVADPEAWRSTEARIAERFGRVDLAVANAGVGHPIATIEELRFEDWRRVVATNLDGVFLTLQTALRFMRRGGRGGSVVVLSSANAIKAEVGASGYGASKAAVLQLTRAAAKEGAPAGIRVNALMPGGVETPCSTHYLSSAISLRRRGASAARLTSWPGRRRLSGDMPGPKRPRRTLPFC